MKPFRPRAGVVVTGCGTINALGHDVPTFWEALCRGECGIRPLRRGFAGEASFVAACVPDPLPVRTLAGASSRVISMALVAAGEALRQAELGRPADPARIGVVLGTTAGGILEVEDALEAGAALEDLSPRLLRVFEKTDVADALARELGLGGPRQTVSTACASGASAILLGAAMIESGEADIVLAGGAETLVRLTLAGFRSLRALDPGACRPFDRARRGLSLGEGAGMLVLEAARSACARRARVLGELLGAAETTDAHHVTAPPEDGSGAARAMREALRRAEVGTEQVDHVNGHGTGTPQNDAAEAAAIRAALGARAASCPVHSIKGAIGHTLGAAGAIGAIATLRSLASGIVPPTVGLSDLDPVLGLDVVKDRPRRGDYRIALSNSFGFGGANAVLCLGKGSA